MCNGRISNPAILHVAGLPGYRAVAVDFEAGAGLPIGVVHDWQ